MSFPDSVIDMMRAELQAKYPDVDFDDEDFNGYLMYPKVFADYVARHEDYGPVRVLPTLTYFYGMEPGDEITAEIDPGKTLETGLHAERDATVKAVHVLPGGQIDAKDLLIELE